MDLPRFSRPEAGFIIGVPIAWAAPRWAPVLFGFAGALISAHPPPFGPTGLILFAAATVLIMRRQHLVAGPVPHPSSA